MAPPEAFEETMLPKDMLYCGQKGSATDVTPEQYGMQYRYTAQLEDAGINSRDRNPLPNDVDYSHFRQYLTSRCLEPSCKSPWLEPGYDGIPFHASMQPEGLHSPGPKIPDQNDGDCSASCTNVVAGDGEECSLIAKTPASNPENNDNNNATATFPSSIDQFSTEEILYKDANNVELKYEQKRTGDTALRCVLEGIGDFVTKYLSLKLVHSVCEEENNVELPSSRVKGHSWENLDSGVDEPARMAKVSHKTAGSKLKSLPLKQHTGCLLSLPVMATERPKGSPYRDKEATEDTVLSAEGDGSAKPVYSECSFQEGSALDSSPDSALCSSPCFAPGPSQDHSEIRTVAEPLNKTQLGGKTKQKESPKYERVDKRERNKPARKKHRPTWTDGSPVDADSSSSPKHSCSKSDDAKRTQSSQQNNNGRKGSSGARRWRGRVDRFGGGGGDDGEENAPPNDRKTDHSINPTAEEEMKKKPAPGMHGAFSVDYPHPPVPPEAELRETDDQQKFLYHFKPPPKSTSDLESTSMSSYSGESNDYSSSCSALATAKNFESEPLRRVPVQNDTGFQSTPTGLLGVADLPDDADATLECRQDDQPPGEGTSDGRISPPPPTHDLEAADDPPHPPVDANITPDCPVFNGRPTANVKPNRDDQPQIENSDDSHVPQPPRQDPEVVADPPPPPVAETFDQVLDSFEYLDNDTFQDNKPTMAFSPTSFTSQYGEGSPLLQVRPDVIAAGHGGEAHFNGFCGCPAKECDDTMPNRSELVVTNNLSPLQRPLVVPPIAQEDELLLHDEDPLVLLRPDTIETHTTAEEYYVWSFSALVDVFVAEANDFLNNDNDD